METSSAAIFGSVHRLAVSIRLADCSLRKSITSCICAPLYHRIAIRKEVSRSQRGARMSKRWSVFGVQIDFACTLKSVMNVNTGKPWSAKDLADLRDFSRMMTRAQLANYLCRSQ